LDHVVEIKYNKIFLVPSFVYVVTRDPFIALNKARGR